MQDVTKTYGFSGPPRHVPLLTKLHLLFGGFLSQFGWIFFGFGLVFVWIFTLNADLTGWIEFGGDLQTAPGVITDGIETNTSVNEQRVYEYHYRFDYEGTQYTGTSYQTGGGLKDNHSVTIEFPDGHPENNRIKGMRRSIIGLFGLMPIIFPAIGLCFIIAAFRKGKKGILLLIYGEIANGTLINKEITNTRINNQPVYKLTFEFTAADGNTYRAFAKNHKTARLQDEAAEPLLYDPMEPAYAVLLDNLPGFPRINAMGQVVTTGFALPSLLIPLITLVGHTAYWCIRLSQ